MSLFKKLRRPFFYAVSDSANLKLEQLQSINASCLPADIQKKLEGDIKRTSLGIKGEQNVVFELQNSHMPMLVLQDLYFEHGDLSAQIDFLVITRKCVFVIECKNLYGDILIDSNRKFMRVVDWNTKKTEGMYSPITQNQRHLDLIKALRFKEKGVFTSEASFEREFNNVFRPVVVIANDKAVFDAHYAPADVKALVTYSDDLVAYIKRVNEHANVPEMSDKQLEALGVFFVSTHVERRVDYAEKYRTQMIPEDKKVCPKCGKEMVEREAKKGPTAGTTFWGCPGYPKCDGKPPK